MQWEVVAWPDRAQYRPGEAVGLDVRVAGPTGAVAALQVRITCLGEEVAAWSAPVALDAGGAAALRLPWRPPAGGSAWQAFGADLALAAPDGTPLAAAGTAFDVAPHWQAAPRYGFMSDFGWEGAADDARRLEQMLRLHLNVVQFYDWMYTHHTYLPPEPRFVDPLGRRVDMDRVRARISAGRDLGMAAIAYAAVYGAENPLAAEHPDWLLYDGGGRPMSLAGLFFIQDPSPGTGWRAHLMDQYRQALELGFLGLHCDTYGFPKAGLAHGPGGTRLVKLDQVLPGLVSEAEAMARAADPAGGVIFNNVGGWPLEAVARTDSAALYVEVWPPMSTYRDLYELAQRARRQRPDRQVIFAAYLPPFHPDQERPAGAMAGLRLASAAIFASGAFHLLPGEGNAVLAEAYYPQHGRLSADDWETVRAYWDFQTRYGPLLADPAAADASTMANAGTGRDIRWAAPGVRFSPLAEPGAVWVQLKDGPSYQVVHLINLTGVTDPTWTAPQPEPPAVGAVEVRLEALVPPRAVWTASPDAEGGRPVPVPWRLEYEGDLGQTLVMQVPGPAYWRMLVVEWSGV